MQPAVAGWAEQQLLTTLSPVGVCVQPADNVHTSVVQLLLSLHFAALGVNMQPEEVQTSSVQAIPSAQAFVPGTHVPPEQASPTVQALPSEQVAPLAGVKTHPWVWEHVSNVQGLLSLQVTAVPPAHWPVALHSVPLVQALLSSHADAVHLQSAIQLPVVASCTQLCDHEPINGAQHWGWAAQTQAWQGELLHPADDLVAQQLL